MAKKCFWTRAGRSDKKLTTHWQTYNWNAFNAVKYLDKWSLGKAGIFWNANEKMKKKNINEVDQAMNLSFWQIGFFADL